jgi:hypothetical protein
MPALGYIIWSIINAATVAAAHCAPAVPPVTS